MPRKLFSSFRARLLLWMRLSCTSALHLLQPARAAAFLAFSPPVALRYRVCTSASLPQIGIAGIVYNMRLGACCRRGALACGHLLFARRSKSAPRASLDGRRQRRGVPANNFFFFLKDKIASYRDMRRQQRHVSASVCAHLPRSSVTLTRIKAAYPRRPIRISSAYFNKRARASWRGRRAHRADGNGGSINGAS
jgi:hypothetical protein